MTSGVAPGLHLDCRAPAGAYALRSGAPPVPGPARSPLGLAEELEGFRPFRAAREAMGELGPPAILCAPDPALGDALTGLSAITRPSRADVWRGASCPGDPSPGSTVPTGERSFFRRSSRPVPRGAGLRVERPGRRQSHP